MADSGKLYKYRSWADLRHKNWLQQNQLFFASPAEINNPFDFKLTIDFSVLDTLEKKERYIDQMLLDTKEHLIKNNIDLVERKKLLLWRLEHDVDKMQEEYDATSNLWTARRYGVLSQMRWFLKKELTFV